MKNLNISIEKATKPNPVKSVNRKFLYGLCAALFLLICSLSPKAANYRSHHGQRSHYGYRSLYGYGNGFYYGTFSGGSGKDSTDLYVADTLGFTSPNVTSFYVYPFTSSSPFVNNYGDPVHSGNDMWIQFKVADDGYLDITGGTANFDSIYYLFDSNWNLVTSGDDGAGSGGCGHDALQPLIEYYASAGTYYLIVDGTDKYGCATSGDTEVNFSLSH